LRAGSPFALQSGRAVGRIVKAIAEFGFL
jgi:hypothetical protein